MEFPRFDEDQEISVLASWLIIIAFSAAIMIFGWIVYVVVPDAPRYWDFGQFADTPADSPYSTRTPPVARKLPRQIPPLPEAQPQNPVPAELKPQGARK
ncbi:hypothetical protein GMSM_10480 [Geomonas sp. Red276]